MLKKADKDPKKFISNLPQNFLSSEKPQKIIEKTHYEHS